MLSASLDVLRRTIDTFGFSMLPKVFASLDAYRIAFELSTALTEQHDAEGVLGDYGARNICRLWPPARLVWQQPTLLAALRTILGDGFGLVRVLYFDKPPGHSWALPWHKDLTIAVRDHRCPSERFRKPTLKAGVPHVQAPIEVLERMLTARLHLDAVTAENGPLQVLPGSHRTGKELRLGTTSPIPIYADAGDVLLMRPLLAHCSGNSHADTTRHRRILHFEFAADADLPDGYQWYDFQPPGIDVHTEL